MNFVQFFSRKKRHGKQKLQRKTFHSVVCCPLWFPVVPCCASWLASAGSTLARLPWPQGNATYTEPRSTTGHNGEPQRRTTTGQRTTKVRNATFMNFKAIRGEKTSPYKLNIYILSTIALKTLSGSFANYCNENYICFVEKDVAKQRCLSVNSLHHRF